MRSPHVTTGTTFRTSTSAAHLIRNDNNTKRTAPQHQPKETLMVDKINGLPIREPQPQGTTRAQAIADATAVLHYLQSSDEEHPFPLPVPSVADPTAATE
jgi:hypothetical protein